MNFHLACGLVFLLCATITMVAALSFAPEVGAAAMTVLSVIVFGAIGTEAWKKHHG